ncbi:MAG TPA: thiamine pyrophosphate-binding protein [Candidatus Glassbacteria bacterium]|nr:thiamine pyrophosphate-binding protein [Candidatus Glassbacteria bacterium]
MSSPDRQSVREMVRRLLAGQESSPIIGASLVPLLIGSQGQAVVPSLQGGQIMPTMDRVARAGLKQVFFKSEAGLGFALLGMAKSSRRPAVGIVTSGPGGLNTITPLADATRDCAPVGILAGQVPTMAMGTDAFQGIDIVDVVRPFTKSARFVNNVSELIDSIPRDLGLAASRKPGSVFWDLPKDVQFTPVERLELVADGIEHYSRYVEEPELDTDALDRAIELLYQSECPAILAGYGLVLGNVWDEFHELLERTGLPVVHTLPGKASVSSSYRCNMGMLGMHGLYSGSAAIYHSDFVLGLGARYDDRAVGDSNVFAPAARRRGALVHVDVEARQFSKAKELLPHKLCVMGDAGEVVRYLLAKVDPSRLRLERWLSRLEKIKADNPPPPSEHTRSEKLDIIYLLEEVNRSTAGDPQKLLVTDVGNHQMWAAQRLMISGPNSYFTSAGLGTMGSGISQAIGVQLANPDRLVVDIQGDESFFFCGMELRTAVRYGIPVKILLVNNGGQCIVHQWTQHMFGGNNVGVIEQLGDHPLMDYVKNAQSFGVRAEKVTLKKELKGAIERAFEHSGPALVECVVPHEECYPWIKPGSGFPGILTSKAGKKGKAEARAADAKLDEDTVRSGTGSRS